MNTLSSETYNVAWFKLADFVARGEKERALCTYRLLMHSVVDQAFSYQLEGDILLAFEDDLAFERYHQAACLYKKDGNIKKAIAVYEHALFFKTDAVLLEALLDMYDGLQQWHNFLTTFMKYAHLMVQNKQCDKLLQRIHMYTSKHDLSLVCDMYRFMMVALMAYDKSHIHFFMYLRQAIDTLARLGDAKRIDQFLQIVKNNDEQIFAQAEKYVAQSLM